MFHVMLNSDLSTYLILNIMIKNLASSFSLFRVFLWLLVLACSFDSIIAQQSVPTPAKTQQKPKFFIGATIHVGNGTVIENGIIGCRDGKIILVGNSSATFDRTNADVIEAKGHHIYPGFIAANTTLGLVEIEAVRATVDAGEVGNINPHVRSLIAYNAQSQIIPTVRFNGVLLAMVAPQGGLVTGRSSIVELDGWHWEDAALKTDIGIHVNFPVARRPINGTEIELRQADEALAKQVAALYQFFRESQAYSKVAAPKEKNLRLDAMRGLFDGSKKLFIRADEAKTILAAITFAKEFGLTPIIVGGDDAWRVIDIIKEHNVPVMLDATASLPARTFEDVDQPFKSPALLLKAGILTAVTIGGGWQQRNLPFQAGIAAGYGLNKEEALMLITSNTAKILGIQDRVGTLEQGKDATFFVSEGDALDMRSNNVVSAFIRGKQLDLVNKQKFLYEQYKGKFNLK